MLRGKPFDGALRTRTIFSVALSTKVEEQDEDGVEELERKCHTMTTSS